MKKFKAEMQMNALYNFLFFFLPSFEPKMPDFVTLKKKKLNTIYSVL